MPTLRTTTRTYDARPDRIDYRDREYRPRLVSLPKFFPEANLQAIEATLAGYAHAKLILDQGREGACTGFGLAAVINCLQWREARKTSVRAQRVSTRMLYQLAKIYDEWPGEDYEGSSCRGAMKGWHRHGVCTEALWPYRRSGFTPPNPGWQQDAATRPLGAYYRINKDSINDMQAAICEVGAIYVSAQVHKGWGNRRDPNLSEIPWSKQETGGHAFALIGYTPRGFIVQNSWARGWRFNGFAILTYADWVENGMDAWAAVMGAPVETTTSATHGSALGTHSSSLAHAAADDARIANNVLNRTVPPLTEAQSYEISLVMGNDGEPINRLIDQPDAHTAARQVCYQAPLDAAKAATLKLAIYAHGGLNSEAASIRRIQVLAPYFQANGIYPLFITSRTGVLETLTNMIEDQWDSLFGGEERPRSEGAIRDFLKKLADKAANAKDRSLELVSTQIVRPSWSEMKENAHAASQGGGLDLMAGHLKDLERALKKKGKKLEIHLVGHSYGSVIFGHLLDLFSKRRLKARTLTLYAPACTTAFALEHYRPAIQKKVVDPRHVHFDILSDARELDDHVSNAYGRSLLYLISRALEPKHKTPILGMEQTWQLSSLDKDMDIWNKKRHKTVRDWVKFGGEQRLNPAVHGQKQVSDGTKKIPIAHGSFDNDVKVVTDTLKRILRTQNLKTKVSDLSGF